MVKKVLVIYKKSAYQLATEQKNKRILSLIASGDESVAAYKDVHAVHTHTLETVKTTLDSLALDKVDFRYRADGKKVNDYDLVITVGGDGTFLWASKFVSNTVPVMGVNSAPGSSVGFYTCTNAENFREILLEKVINIETISGQPVERLKVEINEKLIQDRILNDVLFAAAHPAAMTKYKLTIPSHDESEICSEEQKSSGIWISTPSGSTGANLSAGGWPLSLKDSRGQYVVREPMKNFLWGVEHKMVHGFFEKGQSVEIACKTRKALLACDGTTLTLPVTIGDRIRVSHSSESLIVVGK